MKKEMQRAAQRMAARAQALGLVTKDGKEPVADLMEELLAASQGFRNAHAWRAAMATREKPVLELESPDEAGCDYKLVEGKGCWLTMGPFSVHPYLTDEGLVVDVYAKGAEDESIASTWVHENDAEAAYAKWEDVDMVNVEAFATENGAKAFDKLPVAERLSWAKRFVQARRSRETEQERLARWKDVLEELGYSFTEDAPGRWQWHAATDDGEAHLESQAEAVADAWRDAALQAMRVHGIDAAKWDALSSDEQLKLVAALGND